MAKDISKAASAVGTPTASRPKCGIVMPISEIDGIPSSHWAEVKQIFVDAISDAGFSGDLVSEARDVGIIQKRIVQRLYDDPVVVVDVSRKNANVMLELGMRLAFDKPTIVVKDDKTDYSFDTSPIEHLIYPSDLRFQAILDFKRELANKIVGTFEAAKKPEYTTFLKHFGTFTVAKIDNKEVSRDQFILDELREMQGNVRLLLFKSFYAHAAPLGMTGKMSTAFVVPDGDKWRPLAGSWGVQGGLVNRLSVPGFEILSGMSPGVTVTFYTMETVAEEDGKRFAKINRMFIENGRMLRIECAAEKGELVSMPPTG
jgi:hypothetical protein